MSELLTDTELADLAPDLPAPTAEVKPGRSLVDHNEQDAFDELVLRVIQQAVEDALGKNLLLARQAAVAIDAGWMERWIDLLPVTDSAQQRVRVLLADLSSRVRLRR